MWGCGARPRRPPSSAIRACSCCRRTPSRKRSPPRSNRGRRCCWCTAITTISFRRRPCSMPLTDWRRSACRRNGTCPPASATASTPKACARAANFWRGAFAPAAEHRPFASPLDRNPAYHVRVKRTEVLELALGLDDDAPGFVGRDGHVPGAVARRRRVRHEIVVPPFDGVADMRRDFGRREGELLDPDRNDLGGAGRSRDKRNKQRAERGTDPIATHCGPYLNSAATCSACCS